MKIPCIIFCALASLLAPLAIAQNSGQDELPSAPSAAREKQSAPKEAPAPEPSKPEQTAPAQATPEPSSPASSAPTEDSKQEMPSPSSSENSKVAPSDGNPPPTSAEAAPKKLEPKKPDSTTEEVDESLPVIRKRVDEVNVVFTVTDKHGRYIKDLKQNDFKVIDDKKPSQIRSKKLRVRPSCPAIPPPRWRRYKQRSCKR